MRAQCCCSGVRSWPGAHPPGPTAHPPRAFAVHPVHPTALQSETQTLAASFDPFVDDETGIDYYSYQVSRHRARERVLQRYAWKTGGRCGRGACTALACC